MNRAVAAARIALYAAVAAGAAFSPNIPAAIALLEPAHATTLTPDPTPDDSAVASLGWMATSIASTLTRWFGISGLAFVTALAILGALAFVEWRARRVSSPQVALAAAAIAAACSLDAVHVGGGAVNGFFFAALLVAFDLSGTGGLIAIAVVTALWCNVSAAGVLAPMFAIAYALGSIVDRASKAERMRSQTAALVAVLATLATPAFAAFPLLAWRATGIDNAVNDLLPGAPYVVAPLGYGIGTILTIVVALAVGTRAARTGTTFVFALAACFAFDEGKFVPFLAIAGAPILAESASRLFAFARAKDGMGSRFPALLAATALPVAIVVALVSVKTLPPVSALATTAPFETLAHFARLPKSHGRLLCTKLAWCDVAERRYDIDVVADSRIAVASDADIDSQRAISGAKKDWNARARAANVDAIFVDVKSGFATVLDADGWTRFATDGSGVLFTRSRPVQ